MEEDAESAQRSAHRAGYDSEVVVSGSSFTTHIYEHINRESSEYDNVAPESSSNIPTKFISQHVALTSSRRKNGAHGASSCGCLVPALLMVLLVTCVTLQSVLIFLRVSGRERDVRREDTTQGQSLRCPDLWISINDKCYFFSVDKKSRSLCDKDCGERDSRLAQVKEKTLQRLVTITGKQFWVGLSPYNIHGGVWTGKWADGSMENVTEGTGTCAKLGSHLTLENCYIELNYICERDAV
ncbi:killer cell lectin-like receptor subfamily G member 1 [Lithobates pipiens]